MEVHSLAAILKDTKESQDLEIFPWPIKPGETHKNDVIKFCERKNCSLQGQERHNGQRDLHPASSVLNEEVELVQTVMDRVMMNIVPT